MTESQIHDAVCRMTREANRQLRAGIVTDDKHAARLTQIADWAEAKWLEQRGEG